MTSHNANQGTEESDEFNISSLWPAYFNLCRKVLREMEQSLSSRDFDRVRVLGHNLKGSGSAYGFPMLTEWGQGIEEAAKERNPEHIASLFSHIRDFLASR